MFAYIHGLLTEKTPVACIVDTNGVGYDIRIPVSTYEKLPNLNESVRLLIHYHVSDDDIRLYGFMTEEERALFRQLIMISRIGPKIALSILSAMSVQSVVQAILQNDERMLSSIPGLGKKSAQRLIIELKDKILEIPITTEKVAVTPMTDSMTEAESALLSLGYKPADIRMAFKDMKIQEQSVEEIIKQSIKYMYKKRIT